MLTGLCLGCSETLVEPRSTDYQVCTQLSSYFLGPKTNICRFPEMYFGYLVYSYNCIEYGILILNLTKVIQK